MLGFVLGVVVGGVVMALVAKFKPEWFAKVESATTAATTVKPGTWTNVVAEVEKDIKKL